MNPQDILKGDKRAISHLLTLVENRVPDGLAVLDALFPHTGRAHLLGITGAPGSGKSSLVNQLVHTFRQSPERKVAVLAIDPTSPFSGGAILGDRLRMRDLAGDPGVFIRSMATRGALGGLAHATSALAQVFDAAGYDMVIIETVGAGQNEVDITRLAHTVMVVQSPGNGDDIQAIKAGILEIADLLVINKADLPGADALERALRSMQEVGHEAGSLETWPVPILRSVAITGEGIAGLASAVEQHAAHLKHTGGWEQRERARLTAELEDLLHTTLIQRWYSRSNPHDYAQIVAQVLSRRLSPSSAVEKLLDMPGRSG
jgi:LAO/AO transport system kinase